MMKQLKIYVLLAAILATCTFNRCKKDKHGEEPSLPPETTTGANTFGCKVNGRVFVPRDGRGRSGLSVQYANLGSGPGGGWYLNIPAINWVPDPSEGVNIGTDSLLVVEGATYPFKYRKKGFPGAFYRNGVTYEAADNNSGELKITRFDPTNRIIAGTFFFTATNNASGQTVNVTEGRFDIRF